MGSVFENKRTWEAAYPWQQDGDEWSAAWGGAHAQWHGCIRPRIFPLLRGRVLEIAPGRGRWTQFLRDDAESVVAVDLSAACVEYCRERFVDRLGMEFFANDGLMLPMIEDCSIDFAFSFDSLVHAEADVLESYLRELARVLKPGAAAFLHHSHLGAHRRYWLDRLRQRRTGLAYNPGWRAASVSAETVRRAATAAGMSCVQQELIPWPDNWPRPIDCLSTLIHAPGLPCATFHNPRFVEEAAAIQHIAAMRNPLPV